MQLQYAFNGWELKNEEDAPFKADLVPAGTAVNDTSDFWSARFKVRAFVYAWACGCMRVFFVQSWMCVCMYVYVCVPVCVHLRMFVCIKMCA